MPHRRARARRHHAHRRQDRRAGSWQQDRRGHATAGIERPGRDPCLPGRRLMTLEIKNLKVSYDRVLAVSDVTLTVPDGSIVALVGGNGNGKSTTLRAVAGLNAPDAGTITFDGRPVQAMSAHDRVPLGISLVPEGRRLFPRLTVKRNLELGAFTRRDDEE